VAFATETVYGVGALAADADAVGRLRELKSRPRRPFSVHLGRVEDVGRYVRAVPAEAERLIRRVWPGPVTLILPVADVLADKKLRDADLYKRLCSRGTIGLRCPAGRVAQEMLGQVEGPVVAASANPAGDPSPRTAAAVLKALDGRVEMVIDSGPTRYGSDSTIVRFGASGWRMVREGVCDRATIRELACRKVLFVCTGNTCRSAMAEGLARTLLAGRLGCRESSLEARGYQVGSAGVFAFDGGRVTPEAVTAAAELGANISGHRSRRLTGELAEDADILFCMSDMHLSEVRRLAPAAVSRATLLDRGGAIPDPIGGGVDLYRRTGRRIQRALRAQAKKGIL